MSFPYVIYVIFVVKLLNLSSILGVRCKHTGLQKNRLRLSLNDRLHHSTGTTMRRLRGRTDTVMHVPD